MLHHRAVDEHVAAADAAQEDAVHAVVQEPDVVEGHGAVEEEEEAEGVVLDDGRKAKIKTKENHSAQNNGVHHTK